MEALALVSLISNVVQSVTFAKYLISTGLDIRNSTSGTSEDVLCINSVYTKLSTFCAHMKSISDTKILADGEIASALSAIKDLSAKCKDDCDSLLRITEKLTLKAEEKTTWKVFKTTHGNEAIHPGYLYIVISKVIRPSPNATTGSDLCVLFKSSPRWKTLTRDQQRCTAENVSPAWTAYGCQDKSCFCYDPVGIDKSLMKCVLGYIQGDPLDAYNGAMYFYATECGTFQWQKKVAPPP
ncbi:hypothetical protein V8F06_013506, partial [Rhypophila decipiens]